MATIVTRSGKGSPLTNNEVDANFNNLNSGKAELSGATFTGEIVANAGIALGDSDKATFGAGDDLQVYHDGSNSYISDQGTGNLVLQGSNLTIEAADGTNYIAADDGGSVFIYHPDATNQVKLSTTSSGISVTGEVSATSLDISGNIDVDGTTNLDVVDIDGALTQDGGAVFNEASADVNFRVESNGNANMLFVDGGNNRVGIKNGAPLFPLSVGATGSLGAISNNYQTLVSVDGGFSTTNVRQHKVMGFVGTTAGNVDVFDSSYAVTDGEPSKNFYTGIFSDNSFFNASSYRIVQGAKERLSIKQNGELVINNSGDDRDFRVESDNSSHALFVNGATGKVNLNTSGSYAGQLNMVQTNGDAYGIVIQASANDRWLRMGHTGSYAQIDATYNSSAGYSGIQLLTGGFSRIDVEAGGNVVINENSKDADFRVESNNNTHALFVDGANGNVMVGGTDSGSAGTINLAVGIVGSTTGGLQLWSPTNGNHYVQFGDSNSSNGPYRGAIGYRHSDDAMVIFTSGAEKFRIDSSGRLLVGQTTNYSAAGGGTTKGVFTHSANSRTDLIVSNQTNGSNAGAALVLGSHGHDYIIEAQSAAQGSALTFTKSTQERMRIDSSGRLLVGLSGASGFGRIETDTFTTTGQCILARTSGKVAIGHVTPDTELHVIGNGNDAQMPFIVGNEDHVDNSTSQSVAMGFGLARDSGTVKNNAGLIKVGKEVAWTSDDANIDSFMSFSTYQNNAAVERVVISSNGNTKISATSFHPLTLERLSQDTAGQVEVRSNGTSRAYWGANSAKLLHVANASFATRFSVDNNGSIFPAGNVVLANAQGIDFSATAGSGTSELLDDYEEGAWTPTFVAMGNGTYTTHIGRYTKIGNIVTANFHIDINALGTASGNLKIAGLPFTSVSTANNYGSTTTTHASGWTADYANLGGLVNPNTAFFFVYYQNTSGNMVAATHAQMQVGNFLGTIIYEAA